MFSGEFHSPVAQSLATGLHLVGLRQSLASQIRDFRGAMQGRTDKGLFITTGTFTRDATKEATRDGAPLIDLIDGEELVERLKELRLGVTIEMVESVEVDSDWFSRI